MYIGINGDAVRSRVAVEEPDDLTRIHVEAGTLADDVVHTALEQAGQGSVDETGHAWLRVDALRELAAVDDPSWAGRFRRAAGVIEPTPSAFDLLESGEERHLLDRALVAFSRIARVSGPSISKRPAALACVPRNSGSLEPRCGA